MSETLTTRPLTPNDFDNLANNFREWFPDLASDIAQVEVDFDQAKISAEAGVQRLMAFHQAFILELISPELPADMSV